MGLGKEFVLRRRVFFSDASTFTGLGVGCGFGVGWGFGGKSSRWTFHVSRFITQLSMRAYFGANRVIQSLTIVCLPQAETLACWA